MLKPAVKVSVGWGSQTETSVNLNFRLDCDGLDWVDCVEYSTLCILYESIESNCAALRPLYFPTIDDQLLNEMTMSKSPNRTKVSPNYVQNMEVIRKTLEAWTLAVLQQVTLLDDESKQWCKQLFFKSQEKLIKFDLLCGVENSLMKRSSVSITPPVSPPRTNNDNKQQQQQQQQQQQSVVAKSDPSHKDYNKSIFTKMSHKFQKIGKPKGGTHTAQSSPRPASARGREEEEEDDEPRLTLAVPSDRASVVERATTPKGTTASRHRSLTLFRSSKPHKTNTEEQEEEAEEDRSGSIVRVAVQRGEEYKPGVIVYDITVRATSKRHAAPVQYSTFQRYNSFKILNEKLSSLLSDEDSSCPLIAYSFPLVPASVAIFGLSDTALSERTRHLDAWFREVCTHYRSMPAQAKAAVRDFLNFDMSRPKDIFVQDQLTWGTIESLAADSLGGSSVLITPRTALTSSVEAQLLMDNDKGSVAGSAAMDRLLADNSRVRESLYAASDAGRGGANNRLSVFSARRGAAGGSVVWETQSSATARR